MIDWLGMSDETETPDEAPAEETPSETPASDEEKSVDESTE